MTKRRTNNKYFLLFILLIIFIPICITVAFKYKNYQDKKVKEETPKIYQANMIMVGDALIHSAVYKDANRLANYNGYDFKPHLEYIKEEVSKYDIAYYNQETILGGTNIGVSTYPRFNSPQEVGDAFIDAGFNLVSLATNHTLDKGEKAIINSRNYWNNQEEIQAVGSYTSAEEKEIIETKILEINNITYAMLNYTYGTNGIPVPINKDYLVNLWDDTKNYEGYKAKVIEDIAKIRDKVDVLIVAMHWGREYTHIPTELEVKTANFLKEQKVDIIIGTHPHVIQPVEYIGDTLVFYSLGNFISSQYQDYSYCSNYKCVIGLMSSLTITKTINKEDVKIEINNVKNNLIYTYYNNYKDFKVIPFSNPKIKDYLKNYSSIYDQYSDIIKSEDPRITTVALGQ